jgi:N-methylhydantoinase A/oxoprolinase/acetone carboxylase beta subunit
MRHGSGSPAGRDQGPGSGSPSRPFTQRFATSTPCCVRSGMSPCRARSRIARLTSRVRSPADATGRRPECLTANDVREPSVRAANKTLQRSVTVVPGLRPSHYRLLDFTPADGIRLSELARASNITKQALGEFVTNL